MSEIKKKFYNLFWKNKSCQNLFLLSKEEFLDTKEVDLFNLDISCDDELNTIKFRSESQSIDIEGHIESRINHFKPIITNLLNQKFNKSLNQFFHDLESNPMRLIFQIIKILMDEDNREKKSIKLLQKYGFIGRNIKTFIDIDEYVKDLFFSKKYSNLLSENNIIALLEGIKYVKEIYITENYKNLYNTNQLLVNALSSEDNFESRIKLFHLLYESNIINASKEDAFIECTNCEPGNYRGAIQLKINPNKLKNLKCPICSSAITYFVPYDLHSDIYNIIKDKDGLLLNALTNLLDNNQIQYSLNQFFLNDIELDCVFHLNEDYYLVEAKMYKINTTKSKLKSKIKEHFGKFLNDLNRIKKLNLYKTKNFRPILLVNVNDTDLLLEISEEVKKLNNCLMSQSILICNINNFFK